jgi:hypothetical protein
MKKLLFYSIITFFVVGRSSAQVNVAGHFYGEDAFKFSQYSNYGSARTAGMGGAFTALGGDASNTFINPAGLAFYNKSEFSISPVFRSLNTSGSYLGNTSNRSSSNAGLGQATVVISKPGKGSNQKRSAFGISYNTLVNFNNQFDYSGSNNRSSIMDYFAEQATRRGVSSTVLDSEFDSNTGFAETPTAMYYQAYMIDAFDGGYVVVEPSFPVEQKGTVTENGNLGQLNVSYGSNFNDRFYAGASLGLQTLSYNMVTNHTEFFPNGEIFNGFGTVDDLIVNGTGLNITLGAIYKVSRNVSIGVNVTTPTAMRLKETIYSAIQIDQKPGTFETDFNTVETLPGDFNYKITSPLRGNVGASFMLPKKVGMFSVEAEYVGYKNMGVNDKSDNVWSSEQKRGIQDYYKNVVNIKAGLELRKDQMRIRGGLNYLPDAINDNSTVDRSKLILSGGLGYRGARFFADAAYSANSYNSTFSPYTLSNTENYDSSLLTNKVGSLSFSVGMFF